MPLALSAVQPVFPATSGLPFCYSVSDLHCVHGTNQRHLIDSLLHSTVLNAEFLIYCFSNLDDRPLVVEHFWEVDYAYDERKVDSYHEILGFHRR